MQLSDLFSSSIAHAYIFDRSAAPGVLVFFEEKQGKKFGAHERALLYDVEQFGIEDSRTVSELASLQTEGETFIAIVARNLTPEAQHALLKTFEEPRAGVHYLLFVENPELLLPTLRSRAIMVARGLTHESKKNSQPNFLTMSLKERFAHIEKLSKNKDDQNAFRDAAHQLFDIVINQLQNELYLKKGNADAEKLERIMELRKYINDRGSSPKQLLEAMAMQI